MFCRRNCLGAFIAAAVFGYLAFRPDKTARADQTPSYSENTEESATHRFVNNQPRHWRQVMVAKH